MTRRFIHGYFALVALLLLAGCKSAEWQQASVASVQPGETIRLRVLHATNERFVRMSPEQLRMMLAATQRTVKSSFGVNVEFTETSETSLAQLFSRLPPSVRSLLNESIYDFKSGKSDPHKLAAGICTTLKQHGTQLDAALDFAHPYLPETAHPKDMGGFCELLAQVMLERLEYWHTLKAADGAPVLDASPYNEWVYWDALGYGDLPYDLVISNQLIASAEYVDVDVHSAIRGGLTVGTTSYSRNSKYSSFVFWSTFPFSDNSDNTRLLRGGEKYSDTEAAELAGIYLAHEIGHVLFQFGHPFGQNACVMNPVSMLRFREWSKGIDGKDCAIGSRPEMTPGAIPVYYNTKLQEMMQAPRVNSGYLH